MKTGSIPQEKPPEDGAISAWSIVVLDKFIQATRDSGYEGTASAIAELVDNSIEAGAKRISITIRSDAAVKDYPLEVAVLDDGCGMDPFTLRQALRFGGSTRFNKREGLGRYGMGLPNSSLSQARRLTVYTWRTPGQVYSCYLDVDEIASGAVIEVPAPTLNQLPCGPCPSPSGTLVLWTRCDRLDARRATTNASRLSSELAQRFRYFLWGGVELQVNGEGVIPFDPLSLHPESCVTGGSLFGEPMVFEIASDPDDPQSKVGKVVVTFSELPVRDWSKKSNKEKRDLGISKGAGVSVVRAGREVDYGWFFMGQKRRENYDDWWRCEVRFDPVLDEVFGITHTKQKIRPSGVAVEVLTPDMEGMAKILNNRARRAHLLAKAADRFSDSERIATECERRFKPLPAEATGPTPAVFAGWSGREAVGAQASGGEAASAPVKVMEEALRSKEFFTYSKVEDRLVLLVNPEHPFYRQIYRGLVGSGADAEEQFRTRLELVLLAFARAGLSNTKENASAVLAEQVRAWSGVLATYLNR